MGNDEWCERLVGIQLNEEVIRATSNIGNTVEGEIGGNRMKSEKHSGNDC